MLPVQLWEQQFSRCHKTAMEMPPWCATWDARSVCRRRATPSSNRAITSAAAATAPTGWTMRAAPCVAHPSTMCCLCILRDEVAWGLLCTVTSLTGYACCLVLGLSWQCGACLYLLTSSCCGDWPGSKCCKCENSSLFFLLLFFFWGFIFIFCFLSTLFISLFISLFICVRWLLLWFFYFFCIFCCCIFPALKWNSLFYYDSFWFVFVFCLLLNDF